jgi:hypothetical protein
MEILLHADSAILCFQSPEFCLPASVLGQHPMALAVLKPYNSCLFNTMNAPNSSAPGPSTPGGELEQISPGASPTADGGQVDNSATSAAIPQSIPASKPGPAKPPPHNSVRLQGNAVPKLRL